MDFRRIHLEDLSTRSRTRTPNSLPRKYVTNPVDLHFLKLMNRFNFQPEKDPFGCDPFAILHAPTRDGSAPPRPTSPSPALPPKKSKQPPPRPAPPRPAAPPAKRASQGDAFGGGTADPFSASSGGGGGFADFSDFDAKVISGYPML